MVREDRHFIGVEVGDEAVLVHVPQHAVAEVDVLLAEVIFGFEVSPYPEKEGEKEGREGGGKNEVEKGKGEKVEKIKSIIKSFIRLSNNNI